MIWINNAMNYHFIPSVHHPEHLVLYHPETIAIGRAGEETPGGFVVRVFGLALTVVSFDAVKRVAVFVAFVEKAEISATKCWAIVTTTID